MSTSNVIELRDRAAHRAGAPIEWLFTVLAEEAGHRRLLDESGSIAIAAFRLACARCRTSATPSDVPTTLELRGAAREIARRSGLDRIPSLADLVAECEAAGHLVI
jgi:hypothetical protein